MKKQLGHILLAFAVLFWAANAGALAAAQITLANSDNSAKTGESADTPRIIALGAPAVEIICALGLQEAIIARGSWDVWPPSVRALPHVGNASNLNMELLLHLKPNIVVADVNYPQLAARLAQYDIPLISVNAFNIPDVIPAVEQLAAVLNMEQRGSELVRDLQAFLDLTTNLEADIPQESRPRGLALTGSPAYYSFSDNSGWRLLAMSGARNICADMTHPFPSISREWLLTSHPDFVLISPYRSDHEGLELGEMLEQVWRSTSAKGPLAAMECVKAGKLLVMDDLLTFGLRSIPGTVFIASRLYPDRFTDIDPEELHAAFLQKYFNISEAQRHIYP